MAPRNRRRQRKFEKKVKQLIVSLSSFRDTYTSDDLLLSEKINSRYAFLNQIFNHVENLSNSNPTLSETEDFSNSDTLVWLSELKDILVKQDEISAALTTIRLTSLQEIIMAMLFSELDEGWLEKKFFASTENLMKLEKELRELKRMELSYNYNPTYLSQTLKVLCEKLNTFKEMLATNSTLDVDEILINFSHSEYPPHLDEGWRDIWNQLYQSWNELYQTLMTTLSLSDMDVKTLKILCERLNTLDMLLKLKDMLVKEDQLSAKFTNSRLTSLQEIINDLPTPRDNKWKQLNKALLCWRAIETQGGRLLAMRSNAELLCLEGYQMLSQVRLRSPSQEDYGPVYNSWIKLPPDASP